MSGDGGTVADMVGDAGTETGGGARRRAGAVVRPVVLFVLFGALTWWVTARHGRPAGPDGGLLRWSVAHRPGWGVDVAKAVTATGTDAPPYLAALAGGVLAAGAVALWRGGAGDGGAGDGGAGGRGARVRRVAVVGAAFLVVLIVEQCLRLGLMHAIGRARPPVADRAVEASAKSFPSGHAATSAVAYGLLAYGCAVAGRGRRRGKIAAVCCVGWALCIGLSRIYLGVHWSTDVAAGWLLAAGWLACAIPLLRRVHG